MVAGRPGRRGKAGSAVGVSFIVYLLPLIGPGAAFPFGMVMFIEIAAGVRGRPLAWIASDVALALALQSLAALTVAWYQRDPRWPRVLSLLGAGVVLFFLLQWAYLSAIPKFFEGQQGHVAPSFESVVQEGEALAAVPAAQEGCGSAGRSA